MEKVHSIWICNRNIPPELRDTVTEYSIQKKDIIGTTAEPERDSDLLDVILIRRGGKSEEDIFEFLDALFGAKIRTLEKYMVEKNEKLEKEVADMSGLGASILQEGIEQGIAKERMDAVGRMIRAGIPREQILFCGYLEEEYQEAEKRIK